MRMLFERQFKRLKHNLDIRFYKGYCAYCKEHKKGPVDVTDRHAMIVPFFSSNELSDLTRKDIVKWISRHKFTRIDATVNNIVVSCLFYKDTSTNTYHMIDPIRAKVDGLRYSLYRYFQATLILFLASKLKTKEKKKEFVESISKDLSSNFIETYFDKDYQLIDDWDEILENAENGILHKWLREEYKLNAQGKYQYKNKVVDSEASDKSWKLFKDGLMPPALENLKLTISDEVDLHEICNTDLSTIDLNTVGPLVMEKFEQWYNGQAKDTVMCNLCYNKKEVRKWARNSFLFATKKGKTPKK